MSTLQELIEQKAQLERAITQARNEGRAQALTQIVALMNENGLSAEDVARALQPGQRTGDKVRNPVAPKYRDPSTGATWSGRGLRPRWLASAIARGKPLTDFGV